ncbi:MAG: cytochrome c biogenesis protein CcdA [Spirochaetales bacterium]|nr:cytochrome c biogenesis protein CcdA [Spirochaetales bacterium]
MKKSLLIFFVSLCCVLFLVGEDVLFNPEKILLLKEDRSDFFGPGESVSLENTGFSEVTLHILSSRPELKVSRPQITLAPGETSSFDVSYDGEIPPEGERIFSLVLLAKGGTAPSRYMIYSPRDYSVARESKEDEDISLVYYYSPNCKDCRDFLDREIPRLEEKVGLSLGLEGVNIYEEEGMERLKSRLVEEGVQSDVLPVLDTGEVLLIGDEMIRQSLEDVLTGKYVEADSAPGSEGRAPLWILVAGAGLLDGINPCAFSTLIFLLAYLGLRKRDRREILFVGIFFSLTVFLTYTAVGAGAFLFLRQSMSYVWIGPILRWGGAGVLTVLGALSLRDWYRVRTGRAREMTLQLSDKVKKAVHKSVREGVRSTVPLMGACVMGFMVTVYELGCTGQIYLPTLYLMIRQGEGRGLLLLILYNLAFIVPLVLVFFLAYRGMTSEKLSRWFQDRLGLVKIVTALFFWIAALLIIFL